MGYCASTVFRTLAGVATLLLFALGASTVFGGNTERAEFDLVPTAKAPDKPTGLALRVRFKHPEDPDRKPPPLTGGVIELPRGMLIDDNAVAQCGASDEDFQLRGRAACPPGAQVGGGELDVMLGLPGDPQTLDVVAYNGDGQLIEVVFFAGTNIVAGIDRVEVQEGRLVPHPPVPPGGPPDGKTALRELRLQLERLVGDAGRAYIRTPTQCRSGRWVSRATFEFADGGKTTVPSRTACKRRR